MVKRMIFLLFLIFLLNGGNLRLLEENLKIYQIIYPEAYLLKEKVPVIIAVAPERNVDFFLGKWNEFVGDGPLSIEFSCIHGDALEGYSKNKVEKETSVTKCTTDIFYSPYAFIPENKRFFDIVEIIKIGSYRRKLEHRYHWSNPYWFRIKLKKDFPFYLKAILRPDSIGKINIREISLSIVGMIEKYESSDKVCGMTEIETRCDETKKVKCLKEKVGRWRDRFMNLDGKCLNIREKIGEDGEIERFEVYMVQPVKICDCIPEIALLYDGVELYFKGKINLFVAPGEKNKLRLKKKMIKPFHFEKRKFLEIRNWRMETKKEKKRLYVRLHGRGRGNVNLKEERGSLTGGIEYKGKVIGEAKRKAMKPDFHPEGKILRDVLMEVELKTSKGEKEKALIYFYQLGSPKGGKRLTWFDWSQVVEGEGKIELCNGDVAPALMFEDKNCGKTSIEFCLKTEGEIKSIRITKIRATNYAGEIWEESLNLSTRVDGGKN